MRSLLSSAMPTESTHSGDEEMVEGANVWDETMEMALCYAAIKFKPVGMKKSGQMHLLRMKLSTNKQTQTG